MMIKSIKLGIFILMIALFANPAQALVLDFEALYSPSPQSIGGSAYGGLEWDANLTTISETTYNSLWYNSVAFPSGDVAVFNSFGTLGISIQGQTYDFNGAYFSSWKNVDYGSASITMTGFASGDEVGSVTYALSDTFEYYSAEFLNIDTLVLTSSGSNAWWLMDNFTINEPRAVSASPVPEPATALFLGAGVLGLITARRKELANQKSI